MIGNSGRFSAALTLILADKPFERFLRFSDALHGLSGSTRKIALKRLFELTYTVMTEHLKIESGTAAEVLARDYLKSGEKGLLSFLRLQRLNAPRKGTANKRQRNYL